MSVGFAIMLAVEGIAIVFCICVGYKDLKAMVKDWKDADGVDGIKD